MKRFKCKTCGYVHYGTIPPKACIGRTSDGPCGGTAEAFEEVTEGTGAACAGAVGVAANVEGTYSYFGVEEDILTGLNNQLTWDGMEVGMYIAMARQAEREGYFEIASAYRKFAEEEAEQAGRLAELLGAVVTDSTEKNLEIRAAGETRSCAGKLGIAEAAGKLGMDEVHDALHEMAKEEQRHAACFSSLLTRYFYEAK